MSILNNRRIRYEEGAATISRLDWIFGIGVAPDYIRLFTHLSTEVFKHNFFVFINSDPRSREIRVGFEADRIKKLKLSLPVPNKVLLNLSNKELKGKSLLEFAYENSDNFLSRYESAYNDEVEGWECYRRKMIKIERTIENIDYWDSQTPSPSRKDLWDDGFRDAPDSAIGHF